MRFRLGGCGMANRMPSRTQSGTRCTAADAVIRVYDTGNVIDMHEHKGDFKEP